MKGIKLEHVYQFRDLGVIFDSSLVSTSQINNIHGENQLYELGRELGHQVR